MPKPIETPALLDDGSAPDRDVQVPGPRRRPRSTLNALDVRAWMRFTKSWFVCNPPPRTRAQVQHPAKFPEALVAEFVSFFTKPGETVLDPFSGVGSAVVGAASVGRRGVGIELSDAFHESASQGLTRQDSELYIHGDARQAAQLCQGRGIERVHYVITSPPYWNMLGQSRGNVRSTHKERAARGLRTSYGAHEGNLGNIAGYDDFLEALTGVFCGLKPLLTPNRYLTLIVQNVRVPSGEVKPLAWDLARSLSGHFTFKGEKIWAQDNKKLGCWGWPSEFVTNVHHHYCLVFKNDRGAG